MDSSLEQSSKKPRIDIDELLKGFEEPIKCPFCSEELPQNEIVYLGCRHILCKKCVHGLFNTQGIPKCPSPRCDEFIKPPPGKKPELSQLRALIKACYYRAPENKIEINKMIFKLKELKMKGHDVKMCNLLVELSNIMYYSVLQQIIKDLKQVYDL